MKIKNFVPFKGQHCETTATGNLLKHAGLALSEPMLFGLGEGLAFAILLFKNMPAPFIGGRLRSEEITQNLSKNLGFELEYRTTRSKKRAWENVACFVDAGQPVGVKLDAYFLDYFTSKIHFAAHYLAVYGYDDERVYVVDTQQQGGEMVTSRDKFEEGRLWKGPMASNALTWTITLGDEIDFPTVIRKAIRSNAQAYLNPPIRNFGAKGIRKAAKLVPTWLETVDDAPAALKQIGMLMERGGTGGSLFRNFYRDFLAEANTYLNSPILESAHAKFCEVAPMWQEVASKFDVAGVEGPERLLEAADLMLKIADLEEEAVSALSKL
jgi:hypothetical protein